MGIEVSVLRVFTDADGNFGNKLAVVDAAAVAPELRARFAAQLGYPETIFIDPPASGSTTANARIHTPRTELPFAGHPALGAAWWLRERGSPVRTLQVPAGVVQVSYDGEDTVITARSEWSPAFAIHRLDSADALGSAVPADYSDDTSHYLWAWTDEERGALRARMFAAVLGVPEDEATGSAAVRLTDLLSRDLTITQGRGSVIQTSWSPEGWVRLGGRVVGDDTMQVV